MSTYKIFDVVVVPFPFSDKKKIKNRPAVIVSKPESATRTLAMITSATNPKWNFDLAINDLDKAGLQFPCSVRMKLFTLDEVIIKAKIGELGRSDKTKLKSILGKYLNL